MPNVTLEQLRASVRDYADMNNSQFISDALLDYRINKSAQELHDKLIDADQDYYTEITDFTVASGASTANLPDGFYKLRGLDKKAGDGNYYPVRKFQFLERGAHQDAGRVSYISDVRYRIFKKTLRFLPPDNAPGDYRLYWVPTMSILTEGDDPFDGFNGWDEYIVLLAAIKCLTKEESDTGALEKQLAPLNARIDKMSANQDYGEPDRIQNVRRYNDEEECD